MLFLGLHISQRLKCLKYILKKVLSYIHHKDLSDYAYHSNRFSNIKNYLFDSTLGYDYNNSNKKIMIEMIITNNNLTSSNNKLVSSGKHTNYNYKVRSSDCTSDFCGPGCNRCDNSPIYYN